MNLGVWVLNLSTWAFEKLENTANPTHCSSSLCYLEVVRLHLAYLVGIDRCCNGHKLEQLEKE